MDSITVRMPNGSTRTATYRGDESDAAYVRIIANGRRTTVSGRVKYHSSVWDMLTGRLLQEGYYAFEPMGANAGYLEN